MLKVRRSVDKRYAIFALSGRIEEEHVIELQRLFEAETEVADITLDLEEVRLVDRPAVRFLAACEARGIKLKNCPSYIREWIETGSDTNHEPQC
jgi:anti-anti-sigma regulatory factor